MCSRAGQASSGHTITTLAESPVRPGILFAGTDDGNVWLTRNDGANWENLTTRFPALRDRIWEDGEVAEFVNVYVDGEDVRTRGGLDSPVRNGATVILLPAMAGGRA